MVSDDKNVDSPYASCRIVLTTKHGKEAAIGPAFRDWLSAEVFTFEVDTDRLGTFSGEVEREGTASDCIRRKCEWGLTLSNRDCAIASEGSFGPHPSVPFFACDYEMLYFIDRRRNFHLEESLVSERTNYRTKSVASSRELSEFAEKAQFPSHALILRPNQWQDRSIIFKGIQSQYSLDEAFQECLTHSTDSHVWVETDMRAHLNPTRMAVIAELAQRLAKRLSMSCPSCKMPGWGMVRAEKGLLCEYCNLPTPMIAHEVMGCVSCPTIDRKDRSDGLRRAPPQYCSWCNP